MPPVNERLLALALGLALANPVASASHGSGAPAPNLVPNPSFEESIPGDPTNPAFWSRWQDAGGSGKFAWDSAAGKMIGGSVGRYALKVSDTGSRGGWISEPVEVGEGREYVLAGFVAAGRAAGEVRLVARFLSVDGILGEALTPAVTGGTGSAAADWAAVAVRFRPPEGCVRMQVICIGDSLAGDAWFDDLRLVAVGPAAGAVSSVAGTAGTAGREALAIVWAGGGAAEFLAAFRKRSEALALRTESMRRVGKFWQAAEVARLRAESWSGCGETDLAAGWSRRGWERLRDAARELARAEGMARAGEGRNDPFPAADGPGSVFPVGVSMPLRHPVDPAAVGRQFAIMARAGLRDIELDFPWGLWEPQDGKYDFALVDALFAEAEKNGVRLFPVSGPKYAQAGGRVEGSGTSLMGYTGWYLERYPESSLLSASGERVGGCDGLFREFAFVNPARLKSVPPYLARWETSLSALALHARGQRALGGWFLSAMPRLGAGPDPVRHLLKPGLLGHDPWYAEAFRGWLRDKYKTPAALRRAWGPGAPASFDGVVPPGADRIVTTERSPDLRYHGSRSDVTDWLLFRAAALGEGLAWQAGLLGEKSGVPAVPMLWEIPVGGSVDPDGLDPSEIGAAGSGPAAVVLAADSFPLPLPTHAQDLALAEAGALGSGRPIWLADYSLRFSGVYSADERTDVFPPHLAAPYVFGALAGGARGFFFRSWSARTGPASLALAGRVRGGDPAVSDSGVALATASCPVRVLAPWLAGAAVAPPRYGLLISRTSILFDDPGGRHAIAMLNALALAGINDVRVFTDLSLADPRPLPVSVLFAPYVTRVEAGEAEFLAAFVRAGGILVADSYLASVSGDGPARPLGHGLDALFGVVVGPSPADDRTIGALLTPAFTQRNPPVPVSLSYYGGGYRLTAGAGTEVLAVYTQGERGKEAPAITVRAQGGGKAVIIPRVTVWPDHGAGVHLPRAELRMFRLGRGTPDLNGFFYSMVLRALLDRLGALPAARLVRAPVAETHLAGQAELLRKAGIVGDDIKRSEAIFRNTQCGLPYLIGDEIAGLKRDFGLDPDACAAVRVDLMEGGGGGRLLILANYSSLGRDAAAALPPASAGRPAFKAAVDLETGEEYPVKGGRLDAPLAPYQARLLALF